MTTMKRHINHILESIWPRAASSCTINALGFSRAYGRNFQDLALRGCVYTFMTGMGMCYMQQKEEEPPLPPVETEVQKPLLPCDSLKELFRMCAGTDEESNSHISLKSFVIAQLHNHRIPQTLRTREKLEQAFELWLQSSTSSLPTSGKATCKASKTWRQIDESEFLFLTSVLKLQDNYVEILLHLLDVDKDGLVSDEEMKTFATAIARQQSLEDPCIRQYSQLLRKLCGWYIASIQKKGVPFHQLRNTFLDAQKDILKYIFILYSLHGHEDPDECLDEVAFLRYLIGQHLCTQKRFNKLVGAWEDWRRMAPKGHPITFSEFAKLNKALVSRGDELLDAVKLFADEKRRKVPKYILKQALRVVGDFDEASADTLLDGIAYIFDSKRTRSDEISLESLRELLQQNVSAELRTTQRLPGFTPFSRCVLKDS
eukprot:gb/GECG01015793.1/.p1 GENE.gb/GECG01015793.1/~~gb/GECG01015793.1/.p1  ORF type:complete len:429 (+),score=58.25 gb/GECG01015793.1/:1-1287(+)